MVVTINKQSYELHFGLKALEIFYRSAGTVDKESFFQQDQITAILWGALHNGAYRQEKTLSLSFAAVSDFVEEALFSEEGQKVLSDVVVAFNESQVVKNMVNKPQAEVKKKKSTLKS